MSNDEEPFVLGEDMGARPSFELALRGYDKRQVDRYVEQMDSELAALTTEREQAYDRVQELTVQLHHLQTELRQRPQLDRASFRDLGPMVDQILALAEKQAEVLTGTAAQRAAELESEAEKVLVDTREQAAQWQVDVEREIEQRRTAAERVLTEHRTEVERALARQRTIAQQKAAELVGEAQGYSAELRKRADEQAAAHQQQLATVQKEIQEQRQALTKLQAELEAAQQHLTQSRQEKAVTEREVAQLQQRLGETRQDLSGELTRLDEARRAAESVERHAKEVRARVQREAKRVADLAAAAVMAAAAGGGETAEYPLVGGARQGADRMGGKAPDQHEGTVATST